MDEKPGAPAFPSVRRKAMTVSQESMVKSGSLDGGAPFPLVMKPAMEGVNLASWAAANREALHKQLLAHGAILFRGFGVDSVEQFQGFTGAVSPELLDYNERAAPRTEVGKSVYTSTEFPPDQHIPMHHEMSYSHNWPTKIWFYCDTPPADRGCTPIVDDRAFFPRLDARIKQRFLERKVMYVRNYGEGVDLPWQEVFQTSDPAAVEEYCRSAHMTVEWKGENRVRTRAVRQAVVTHPQTGDEIWFNHAHMFHQSNLTPAVREALLAEFAEDELPRNAFYGDGTPIETSVLDEIRGLYEESAVRFPWQKGDVLMVDNILASHGREPFSGPRKILVAMAELYTNPDL
jgi:alpha-ketoglutarate-dependent taurine dioxygenase